MMSSLMMRRGFPALLSAGTVLAVGALIILSSDLGPWARHMGLHIASMNVIAPLLAVLAVTRWPTLHSGGLLLWASTILQVGLLWASHAPPVHNGLISLPGLQLALHGLLLLTAMLFWTSLLTLSGPPRWQAIPALMLTAKLVCLLGALLIFAPRALYGTSGHLDHGEPQMSAAQSLNDQHLAGLLMIAACPLSYLVAAVAITAQLINLRDVSDPARWRRARQTAG